MIFWSLCLTVAGALFVWQPVKMLHWTIRQNPELAEKKDVLTLTRFIGGGLIGIGAIGILAAILR